MKEISESITARFRNEELGKGSRFVLELYKPEARGQAFAVVVFKEDELPKALKGHRFDALFQMWEEPR